MRLLVLSAIFSGLAGWTKNEGLFLFLCNWCVLISFWIFAGEGWRRIPRRKEIWIYLIIGMMINLPWIFIKGLWGLQNDVINAQCLTWAHFVINLPRFSHLPLDLFSKFMYLEAWNVLWIIFIVFAILDCLCRFFDKFASLRYIFLSIALQFAIIIFLYMIYPYPGGFINDTMLRLMMAPSFLAVIYIMLSLGFGSKWKAQNGRLTNKNENVIFGPRNLIL